MSPKFNLMDPFLQLIITLAVAWNGCSKIMGVCDLWLDTGCLKNYEINKVDKFSDLDKNIINFSIENSQ